MKIAKQIVNLLPLKTASGPFHGTRCSFTATGDAVVAKLAGTYEMELHPAFRHVVQARPDVVVDIGAAEGFYLAALARAIPGARILAYEAKEEWHQRIRHNLALNGITDRFEIRGFCDMAAFQQLLRESGDAPTFILMDIEGGEFELLDSEMIALASNVSFIIELHEPTGREAGDALIQSFRTTHDVEVVWQNEHTRSWREVRDPKWRLAARLVPAIEHRLHEGRVYKMRWLCAWAKEQKAQLQRTLWA